MANTRVLLISACCVLHQVGALRLGTLPPPSPPASPAPAAPPLATSQPSLIGGPSSVAQREVDELEEHLLAAASGTPSESSSSRWDELLSAESAEWPVLQNVGDLDVDELYACLR